MKARTRIEFVLWAAVTAGAILALHVLSPAPLSTLLILMAAIVGWGFWLSEYLFRRALTRNIERLYGRHLDDVLYGDNDG